DTPSAKALPSPESDQFPNGWCEDGAISPLYSQSEIVTVFASEKSPLGKDAGTRGPPNPLPDLLSPPRVGRMARKSLPAISFFAPDSAPQVLFWPAFYSASPASRRSGPTSTTAPPASADRRTASMMQKVSIPSSRSGECPRPSSNAAPK